MQKNAKAATYLEPDPKQPARFDAVAKTRSQIEAAVSNRDAGVPALEADSYVLSDDCSSTGGKQHRAYASDGTVLQTPGVGEDYSTI